MGAPTPHRGAYPLLVGTTWRSTCAHCWWKPITDATELLQLIRAERAASMSRHPSGRGAA